MNNAVKQVYESGVMPMKYDAKFKPNVDAANANLTSLGGSSRSCREFKMLYEGRLQRYCLLLSKEKELIHKLGIAKNSGRLRSRTFDNGDINETKMRHPQIEVNSLPEEPIRRQSFCQPILRSPQNQCYLSSTNGIKTQRRFSESGRLSLNPEAKIQEYKRRSLPSKMDLPKKDIKNKRRQEEMQKKAQIRTEALKSLETDCIKARQLMNRFKSLSMTTLDLVGIDETDNFDVKEDNNGKRRVQSWHI